MVIASTTDLSTKGITLQTGWRLAPEPRQVDLAKLATDSDPNWASYHCPFYPDGFRRGHFYAKTHVPRTWPAEISFLEQWVEPGLDCLPQGSRPLDSNDDARWTEEMLQFVVDMALPIQCHRDAVYVGQAEASSQRSAVAVPPDRVQADC
jgi:hypothetical protein